MSAPTNQVTKLLHESLQKYAKFESPEIKDGVIGDDLEAAEYAPSTGENSVEEAIASLEEAVLDFEASDDDDEDKVTEEDDDDLVDDEDDDEEVPPVKS